MIPDGGCKSDLPYVPVTKPYKPKQDINTMETPNESKLEQGYTVAELKKLYMPDTDDTNVAKVMKAIVKAVKKERVSLMYKHKLSQHQRRHLTLLGYSVEPMSNGYYIISGW